MTRMYLLLSLILAAIIFAGRWLAVGEPERADQLVRDGRLEAALPLLEARYRAKNKHSPRLVSNLAYARLAAGDAAAGIELLKASSADSPHQLEAQSAMRNSFDFARYQQSLAPLSDARSVRERIALAALQGDLDRERLALLDLARGNQIKAKELIHLSALQAARGEYHDAALAMRRAELLLPVVERGGLFVLELKLLTKDGVTSDEDLLKRAKEFLATERGKSISQEILWNFIKLHRPGISLQLIEKPLANRETLNAFIAAKELQGASDDIVATLLADGDISRFPKEKTDLIIRIAPKNPALLMKVLASYEKNRLPLSDEQMTEISYASMELNPQATQAAEAVLKSIAQKRGGNHAAAKALRYLWGPRPKEAVLPWIRANILSSATVNRAAWLDYLVAAGRIDQIVAIAQAAEASNFKEIDEALMKGISTSPQIETRSAAIELIRQHSKNPELLLKAARAAKSVDLFDQAAILTVQSLAIKPKNPRALAFLGILASQRGKHTAALDAFTELASLSPGFDALSNHDKVLAQYLYGISLEETGHREKAREKFKTALETLRVVYSNEFDLTLQAELLAKVEGTAQGIKLLKAQQKRKPLTLDERLLLGRLLTDDENLTEAHHVLFEDVEKKWP